jgi:type I restriction enzyme, S subunit
LNSSIPNSWINATLNDMVIENNNAIKRGPFGSSIRKDCFVSKGYKVYEQKNVIYNDFNLGNYFINEKKFQELKDFELKSGDIVISCAGTIGKIAIAPENLSKGIINQALLKISLNDSIINKEYFLFLFNSDIFQKKITSRGSAMLNLTSVKDLKRILIPLPPLNEQKRLVSKLEELFTKIDAGIEYLRKTQVLLKQYHQSVLKHSFDGKLTEKWRERSKNETLSAYALLEKITEERKKKDKKYEKIVNSNDKKLFKIPKEWIFTTIGTLFDVKPGSTPSRTKKEYWNGDIPWVSSGEVRNNYIYSTKEKITQLGLENSNVKLNPVNTVLLAMIGEGKTRGQTAILKIPAATNQNIAAITSLSLIPPEYLYFWFIFQYSKNRSIGSGGMQKALNARLIKEMVIPLPSLEEQYQIIKEIEFSFSKIENIANTIKLNLIKCKTLHNVILRIAFNGKLVLQNPNDESAEILLEKIKREKAPTIPIRKEKSKITISKSNDNDSKQMRLM